MKLLALAALLAADAVCADQFLRTMRKAEGRREPEERVEYFTRAIAAWSPEHGRPLLAHCHYRRAQAQIARDRLADAEPDLSRAIELDPGNPNAYLLRGRLRLRAGRPGPAAEDFTEAAARSREPHSAEARLWVAQARLLEGRLPAARELFEALRRALPDDERPLVGLARVEMSARRWADALERLEEAFRLKRTSAAALTERAVCNVALARRPEGLADYSEALPLHEKGLSEGDPLERAERRDRAGRAYFGRGRVLEFLSRPADAASDYERGCALGHLQACERAQALAKLAPPPPEPPEPPAQPSDRPKKRRRLAAPEEDSGDRIYAN